MNESTGSVGSRSPTRLLFSLAVLPQVPPILSKPPRTCYALTAPVQPPRALQMWQAAAVFRARRSPSLLGCKSSSARCTGMGPAVALLALAMRKWPQVVTVWKHNC